MRFLTDETGTVVNEYDYDSYGRPEILQESVAQPFLYTGREWDPQVELYHYRARVYDPSTGRFLQEDPIWYLSESYRDYFRLLKDYGPEGGSLLPEASEVRSFGVDSNSYHYANNNPINNVDETGLSISSTYSRLIRRSPKTIRNIDFIIRRTLGTLPSKAGRFYDPRNGRFLPRSATEISTFQAAIATCVANAAAAFSDLEAPPAPPNVPGLVAPFCTIAGTLAGALL